MTLATFPRYRRVRGARGTKELDTIQSCVANRLDLAALRDGWLCGIIGERPSAGARSPALWNAAFADLLFPATYVAMDVAPARLGALLDALRAAPRFLGGSVAVPYKTAIVRILDDLEPDARRAGAVNVIVRTDDGRLVGGNADGAGAVCALTEAPEAGVAPLMPVLEGKRVVVIGAGGAARGVAMALGEHLGRGSVVVANRSLPRAAELAEALAAQGVRAEAIAEADVARVALEADLVVNCSTKGQAGWQRAGDGGDVQMESYSSLAPADPVPVAPSVGDDTTRRRMFYAASLPDIVRNTEAGARAALAIPAEVPFFDAVYAPRETVFLRDGRLTGRRTLGGSAMSVAQAADALAHRVCRPLLDAAGLDHAAVDTRVRNVMGRLW